MEVRRLGTEDLGLIGSIDRSEVVSTGYRVRGGELISYEVDWEIPNWDPAGAGDHSVAGQMGTWVPVLERGGLLMGSFTGQGDVAGLSILEPDFEPGLAWLAFLHVGRPYRRQGVAGRLWEEADRIAAEAGANCMYISATPSESAVKFYLSRGCRLADPPHPTLFANEPEDVHLVRSIG